MERLTIKNSTENYDIKGKNNIYNYLSFECTCEGEQLLKQALNKLGKLEDLNDQKRLFILPCAYGDTIYTIKSLCFADSEVNHLYCETHDCKKCPYEKESIIEEKCTYGILYNVLLNQIPERRDKNNFFTYVWGENTFATYEEAEEVLMRKTNE